MPDEICDRLLSDVETLVGEFRAYAGRLEEPHAVMILDALEQAAAAVENARHDHSAAARSRAEAALMHVRGLMSGRAEESAE